MKEFILKNSDYIALCDLMKTTGMSENGGAAKAFIGQGLVLVDGEVETRKRCKIRENQVVEFQGEKFKVIKNS